MAPGLPPEVARAEYWARIHRVLDYIDSHLDEDLSVDRLARVGCFSPWHFHRLFSAMVGEPLIAFVTRVRIERAASLLFYHPDRPVLNIAQEVGIADAAVFARAFRRRFGVSASAWRKNRDAAGLLRKESKVKSNPGQAASVQAIYEKDGVTPTRWRIHMSDSPVLEVEVRNMPVQPLAYVRHVGPYEDDPHVVRNLFKRLFAWAIPRNLVGPDTRRILVFHDNPDVTPAERMRISAAIPVPATTAPEGDVGRMDLAQGAWAIARCAVPMAQLAAAWRTFFAGWFPQSGWQPDDRPCFEVFLNDPAKHPEHLYEVELWESVRPL